MLKQYGDIYIHIQPGSENVLYNSISDGEGHFCFPDILVRHEFEERAIVDPALYNTAAALQQKYGTACCFFMSACDESAADALAASALSAYASCRTKYALPDSGELDSLCKDLALSQTMRASFVQLMRYYSLTNDVKNLTDEIYSRYELPVRSKAEGKKIYEAVRAKILR